MTEKLTLENWGELNQYIKESIKKDLSSLKLEITSDNDEILSKFKDEKWEKENVSNLRIAATQLKLKELGYDVWKIDGLYGEKTSTATKAFQKNNGLTEDGFAGKDTINKMLSSDVKKAITTDTPSTETAEKKQDSKKNDRDTTSTETAEKKQDSKKNDRDTTSTETKNEGTAKEIIKIWSVDHIVIRPKTIDEIPSQDKRDKTKKQVYAFGWYEFFDNWRAMKISDRSMHNTSDIIPKFKEKELTHKEFDVEYHSTIQNMARNIFQSVGFKYVIRDSLTAKVPYQNKQIQIDISKYCDDRWNLIETERLKNEISKQKEEIDKAIKINKELTKALNFFKDKTYSIQTLFLFSPKIPWREILKKNDIRYTTFFKKFSNETIVFDRDTKIQGENLILELNELWINNNKITIPLKELEINPKNFIFGKSISYSKLEINLRKALAKRIDKIVG